MTGIPVATAAAAVAPVACLRNLFNPFEASRVIKHEALQVMMVDTEQREIFECISNTRSFGYY